LENFKGQHIAVETVFIFGLGLVVAIGVVTLFNDYENGALQGTEAEQANVAASKIQKTFISLKQSDDNLQLSNGTRHINLPDRLAGEDYSVVVENDSMEISAGGGSYSSNLYGLSEYSISGSVEGGSVTIFKREDQMILRES